MPDPPSGPGTAYPLPYSRPVLLAGRGVVRAVRASAAASVVVMLASAAHAGAGGAAPATGPILLGTALIAPICWLLAARRLTLGRLASLLTVAQLPIHLALSALPSEHAGHHGIPALGVGTGAGDEALMLAAHIVAALAAAWLLARGEAVLWRVVRRLAPRRLEIALPARRPLLVPTARRYAVRRRPWSARLSRGPPLPA